MSLGTVSITSSLLRGIAEGVDEVAHITTIIIIFSIIIPELSSPAVYHNYLAKVGERPRIFIRRVFPVQNETEVTLDVYQNQTEVSSDVYLNEAEVTEIYFPTATPVIHLVISVS